MTHATLALDPISGHDAHAVPLTMLRPGQSAVVEAVLGAGEFAHRLREMGLRPGARVQMVRPGAPCLIRLDGLKLGIRADEVAAILVRPRAALAC
jgi:Fe2+ transport system protein FeoA